MAKKTREPWGGVVIPTLAEAHRNLFRALDEQREAGRRVQEAQAVLAWAQHYARVDKTRWYQRTRPEDVEGSRARLRSLRDELAKEEAELRAKVRKLRREEREKERRNNEPSNSDGSPRSPAGAEAPARRESGM